MQKVACGQFHSCFIGKVTSKKAPYQSHDQLYMWGSNQENIITTAANRHETKTGQGAVDKTQVSWPKAIPLTCKGAEYEAVAVACGPTYTFVIGSNHYLNKD